MGYGAFLVVLSLVVANPWFVAGWNSEAPPRPEWPPPSV
jgi:hypothetical protein